MNKSNEPVIKSELEKSFVPSANENAIRERRLQDFVDKVVYIGSTIILLSASIGLAVGYYSGYRDASKKIQDPIEVHQIYSPIQETHTSYETR